MRTLTLILCETATGGEPVELKARMIVPQYELALDRDLPDEVICNAYHQLSSEVNAKVKKARAKISQEPAKP